MSASQIGVIILAAGYSSRMGTFKPNIKLGGVTIAERLIATYRSLDIDVYLVVGWQKEALLDNVKRSDFMVVENPIYHKGMFSSVRTGLEALKIQAYRVIFIQPVDVPLVQISTLRGLREASQKPEAKIYYPCFNSRRGHPVLILSDIIPAILEWNGEGGLKAYLITQENQAQELEVADSNILFDIDTPEDIPELLKRYNQLEKPDVL
jgi:molybdenum cofactor cytidylyltransferase